MKRFTTSVLSLALLTALSTACGGSQEREERVVEAPVTAATTLRVIHAASAPRATAFFAGTQIGGGALAAGEGTDAIEVAAGSNTLEVRGADGTTELASERITLAPETDNVAIVGGTGDGLLLSLIAGPIPTPEASEAHVIVANAHNAPVTVTVGDNTLGGGAMNPGVNTGFLPMTPESYRFEAAAGDWTAGQSIDLQGGHVYLLTVFYTGAELSYIVTELR